MGKQEKPPKVWVCRGCCCGNPKQHPGVAHDRLVQVAREHGRRAGVKVTITDDCVGPCGQGNIVVVRSGGQIRWFRRMNDEGSTTALLGHLGEHGSLRGLPEVLARRVLRKRDGRKPSW